MIVTPPTLEGFIAWVRTAMGIGTDVLPDDSEFLVWAYEVALAIVNCQLQQASPLIYKLAVYNLGGDNLLNWAQDALPLVPYKDDLPFFAYWRKEFTLSNFVPGVINSASDEGTSSGYEIIATLSEITIGQLQNLKTPYGRQYLAFASEIGTNWGVS